MWEDSAAPLQVQPLLEYRAHGSWVGDALFLSRGVAGTTPLLTSANDGTIVLTIAAGGLWTGARCSAAADESKDPGDRSTSHWRSVASGEDSDN